MIVGSTSKLLRILRTNAKSLVIRRIHRLGGVNERNQHHHQRIRFKSTVTIPTTTSMNHQPNADHFQLQLESIEKMKMSHTRRLEKVLMVLDEMKTKHVDPNERTNILIARIARKGSSPQKRKNIASKLLKHPIFDDVLCSLTPTSFEEFIKTFVEINKRDEAIRLFENVYPLVDMNWKVQFTVAYQHIAEDMLTKMEKNGASAPSNNIHNLPSTKVINKVLEFESKYSVLPSENQLLRLINRLTQENRRINVEGYHPPMYLKSVHADSIERLMRRMVKYEIRFVPNLVILDAFRVLMSVNRWESVSELFTQIVNLEKNNDNDSCLKLVESFAKKGGPNSFLKRFVSDAPKCGWNINNYFLANALRSCGKNHMFQSVLDLSDHMTSGNNKLHYDASILVLKACARYGDAKKAHKILRRTLQAKQNPFERQKSLRWRSDDCHNFVLSAYLNDKTMSWEDVITAMSQFSMTQSYETTERQVYRVLSCERLINSLQDPVYWVCQLLDMLHAAGKMPANAYYVALMQAPNIHMDIIESTLSRMRTNSVECDANEFEIVQARYNNDINKKMNKKTSPNRVLDAIRDGEIRDTRSANVAIRKVLVNDTTQTRSMFRALDLMIINGISLNLDTAKIALSIVTRNLNKRSLSFAMQTFLRFETIAQDVIVPDRENCFQDNGVEKFLHHIRDKVEQTLLKECTKVVDQFELDSSSSSSSVTMDFFDSIIVRGCLDDTESCLRFRDAVFESCSNELALELLKRMQYYGASIQHEETQKIEERLGQYVEELADNGNTQDAKRVLKSSKQAGLDYTISGWTALALWDQHDDGDGDDG